MRKQKIYSGVHTLPKGDASEQVTPGCILLEGGSFRGLYTGGVLDRLMIEGINMQCTVGVSAGAMNGFNYAAGQIGRASRFNLAHRHDPNYVGWKALRKNKGIFGFDLVFDDTRNNDPFHLERFMRPDRRFIAVATDCITGEPAYLEKGICREMWRAIQASASMPVISKMVMVENHPYLDGGCSVAVPLDWALAEGFSKIIVVRTRDRDFRKSEESGKMEIIQKMLYRKYPQFLSGLLEANARYNVLCSRLEQMEKEGRIYVIAPSAPVTVSRLEKDVEKLGQLYWQGYEETGQQIRKIQEYLAQKEQ